MDEGSHSHVLAIIPVKNAVRSTPVPPLSRSGVAGEAEVALGVKVYVAVAVRVAGTVANAVDDLMVGVATADVVRTLFVPRFYVKQLIINAPCIIDFDQ